MKQQSSRNPRPERARRTGWPFAAAALGTLAGLVGCESFGVRAPKEVIAEPPTTAVERSANPSALTQHLESIQKLLAAEPAARIEILAAAQRDAEASRLASARLRHALLLGTPGHAGYDPAAATAILNDVLAVPATLPPPERALAIVELQRIANLASQNSDTKRFRDQWERERDQVANLNRRLQAETEENVRLRKALEEARAKLDAISKIETGDRRP